MIIRIFLISITLCLNMSIHSQQIFIDVSKYDFKKIETQSIKKTRKLLNTDKERHLSAMVYYAIRISDGFSPKHCTVSDFLNNIKLIDKYRCFVYDDSFSTFAIAIEKSIFLNPQPLNRYFEHITRLSPEYIFDAIYNSVVCPMFFCYKNGDIIIVHLSDDEKNIISYPLSELKDWRWLNTGEKLIE